MRVMNTVGVSDGAGVLVGAAVPVAVGTGAGGVAVSVTGGCAVAVCAGLAAATGREAPAGGLQATRKRHTADRSKQMMVN